MIRPSLLAIASGLLLAAALPQAIPWISLRELDPAGHLELLAWVGLVPLLFALDRARRARAAFGLGFVGGLAYFYAAIWWVNHAMTAFGGVPWPIALLGLTLLVAFMALHWALACWASHLLRARLGWPLWTHLPLTWSAAELLRNYLFTGFPWANLGDLQARHTTVAQLASLTGVYGIAALIVLVNAAVHALLADRLAGARARWAAPAAAALALAFTIGYGALHLRAVRARAAAAPRLEVGLVQGNVSQDLKNEARENAAYILGRYVPLTREADRRGADLIAWPEATYPFLMPPGLRSWRDPRIGIPPLSRAHLLVGVPTAAERTVDGRRELTGANSAVLLAPDLDVLGRYAKHHLVPFGEYVPSFLRGLLRSVVPILVNQEPGAALRVLSFTPPPGPGGAPRPEVRIAPMICFDAIFPEVNVAFAKQDPSLLLNPTNDAWYGYSSGPYQFLAIVRMRAIEAERAVARPAYAGVTALIAPTGEVLPGALPVGPVDPDLAPDPDEPPRLLMGEVPLLQGHTPYTRFGDLFAGAAAAFAVLALAAALSPLAPRLAVRRPQGAGARRSGEPRS